MTGTAEREPELGACEQAMTPSRLTLARHHAGLSMEELSRRTGITVRTISAIENGAWIPQSRTLDALAHALGFPMAFFEGEPAELFPEFNPRRDDYYAAPVSFRKHHALRAGDRNRVLAAALLGVSFYELLDELFHLPDVAIPDIRDDLGADVSPEDAARILREAWGIGERPIANMVHLLESKGVRVLHLSEDVQEVDAFAFWRGHKPYVVLSPFKSGERGHFDAAHELGHLVLHHRAEGAMLVGREAEAEANRFASAFLLPRDPFLQRAPPLPVLDQLLALKVYFRTSAAAMIKRGQDLGRYTEWQARQAWIEHRRRGWASGEPGALPHDRSLLLGTIAGHLARQGRSLSGLAARLHIPEAVLRANLPEAEQAQELPALKVVEGEGLARGGASSARPQLRLVRVG